MSLESASLINQLVTSNPTSQDPKSQGPAHMRGIKTAIKNTFPNLSSEMSATAGDLNKFKVGGTVSGNLTIKGNMSASGSIVAVSVTLPDNDATATGNISYSTAIGALKVGDGVTQYKVTQSDLWAKFNQSASSSVVYRVGNGETGGSFSTKPVFTAGYNSWAASGNYDIIVNSPGIYKLSWSLVVSASCSNTFQFRFNIANNVTTEFYPSYNCSGLFGRKTLSTSYLFNVGSDSLTLRFLTSINKQSTSTVAVKDSSNIGGIILERL